DQDCTLFLVPLVRLDGRGNLVLGVDFDGLDLRSADAALRIHQRDVVVVPGAEKHADCLRRPGTVALQADDDVLLRESRSGERERRGPCQRTTQWLEAPHDSPPPVCPNDQYENGQTRK